MSGFTFAHGQKEKQNILGNTRSKFGFIFSSNEVLTKQPMRANKDISLYSIKIKFLLQPPYGGIY